MECWNNPEIRIIFLTFHEFPHVKHVQFGEELTEMLNMCSNSTRETCTLRSGIFNSGCVLICVLYVYVCAYIYVYVLYVYTYMCVACTAAPPSPARSGSRHGMARHGTAWHGMSVHGIVNGCE